MSEWQPIDTAPEGVWMWTHRAGEDGVNLCHCRKWPGEGTEWVDRYGRTTITHSSFLPPTSWAHLLAPPLPEVKP